MGIELDPRWLAFVASLLLGAAALALAHYLLLVRAGSLGSEARLPRQLLLLILTIGAAILLIVVSPLEEPTKDQVLTLVGVLLSGVIALSSAPFVTNFMAAVMLRVTRPFAVGDFIRVGEFFGKVSERGMFDTEVQNENRELIAIPNVTFVNQSITVFRKSGVIVSANVSLGYDIAYAEVEPLLLRAAEETGLQEPFLHVLDLGDFSVEYRVAGLLEDVETILTTRSALRRNILYAVHGAGLEIASPNLTRHITHSADYRILPPEQPQPSKEPAAGKDAEALVFDKAKESEELTTRSQELEGALEALKASRADPQKIAALEQQLQVIRDQRAALGSEAS